jgi:DNA-binding SARP family transcriptional activator
MADQTPELHIFALGPPEVRLGEHLVSFPTRKTLALLIYLASEAGMQPRDHLAPLLWPVISQGTLRSAERVGSHFAERISN